MHTNELGNDKNKQNNLNSRRNSKNKKEDQLKSQLAVKEGYIN